MKLEELTDLYNLISRGTENVQSRKYCMRLRKSGFDFVISNQRFIKVAFDTRRMDQETEFNPRRGLQNYNRSEAFITDQFALDVAIGSNIAGVSDTLVLALQPVPALAITAFASFNWKEQV